MINLIPMTFRNFQVISLAMLAAVLASCTAPAPPTRFVDGAPAMKRDRTTPFQRSWMKPGVSFQKYDRVYLSPTNTTYTKVNGKILNSRRVFNKGYGNDVSQQGKAFRGEFAKAFQRSRGKNWIVLDSPTKSRRAIIVESALVQIQPSRVELEAAGYVVPGVSLINSVIVASEVKIRDARTGELLAVFADRQKSPFSPIDLSKLTYYKANRNIMRDWARQTVKWVSRTNPQEQIFESLPALPVAW